jgi:RsiW-degrading membrane proteinase PrsW (M82 family)
MRVLALLAVGAASGAAWARIAAWRAGAVRRPSVPFALLGGAAAFGLALVAFEAAARAGLDLRWERLTRGGAGAFAAAATIGLVEEGAKLAGLLLVVSRGIRTRAALAAATGVAGGFAALESLAVLAPDPGLVAFARAVLAPVGHALLAVPVAIAIAPALRARRPALALVLPLLASAALHGAGDLALALPGARAGFALALVAPALLLFARGRRRRAAAAPLPSWK